MEVGAREDVEINSVVQHAEVSRNDDFKARLNRFCLQEDCLKISTKTIIYYAIVECPVEYGAGVWNMTKLSRGKINAIDKDY